MLDRWVEEQRLALEGQPSRNASTERECLRWFEVVEVLVAHGPRERAIELLESAVPICRRLAPDDLAALVSSGLVEQLLSAGRTERAGTVVLEAVEAHRASALFLPLLELQRVRWLRSSGRWTAGLEAVERVLEGGLLRDQEPGSDPRFALLHPTVRGFLLGERARLELELGRIDRARAAAMAELNVARRHDDAQVRVDALLVLADCDYLGSDPESTLHTVEELRREDLGPENERTVDWLEAMARGGIALGGEPDEARIAVAVRGLERVHGRTEMDERWLQDVEWLLAELALVNGDLEGAARWVVRSRERFDSWNQAAESVGTRELRLLANEAQLACALDAPEAELRVVLGRLEAGFETLLARWSEVELDPGGIGLLETEERRGLLGELVRVRARTDGEAGLERAFEDLMRAQAMGTQARAEGFPTPTLAETRAELLGRGGLLLFVVTGSTTHLLALDAERLAAFELPGRARLQPTSDTFARLLREDAPTEVQLAELARHSASLGRALVPARLWEFVRRWPAARVVGFETLRGTPIEGLETPDGRLLGEALALSRAASVPSAVARVRRGAPAARKRDFTLLVNLEPTGPAAERHPELQAVATRDLGLERPLTAYPPATRHTVLAARPSDFLTALDDAAVVQVLAHGILDPFRERSSGVLFAPEGEGDGSLFPEDVEALAVAPRALVLLASCGTALGPRRTGDDGPTSLAAALVARGASGAVTTAARLELGLAEDLSEHFHRHLAAGTSAAEALRRAKVELGSRDRARAFALARVHLLGSPAGPFEGRPLSAARSSRALPWGGAALLLVLTGLAARRWRAASAAP